MGVRGGFLKVAEALSAPGGLDAMKLRIAEQYVTQFGEIAKEGNTLVVPANLSDVASILALATNVVKDGRGAPGPTGPRPIS